MLIRQSINFAVHLAAGVAFGALLVVAARAMRHDRDAGDSYLAPKAPPEEATGSAP